jgi:hypothetical protein
MIGPAVATVNQLQAVEAPGQRLRGILRLANERSNYVAVQTFAQPPGALMHYAFQRHCLEAPRKQRSPVIDPRSHFRASVTLMVH